MKRALLICFVLGLAGLWSLDEVLAIGGRAGGGGGARGGRRRARGGGGARAGGGARPSGGGARPSGGAVNRSPTMSRPTAPANRPSTRPSTGANRPAGGNIQRPSQLPANRPNIGNNRPDIGNIQRPSQLPANRPNLGNNRPGIGDNRPAIGDNRPGIGNPGAIARPGNRPSAGDLGNFLNLPTQLPAGGTGIGDRLPANAGLRPSQLPALNRPGVGDRFPGVGERPGQLPSNINNRQENRHDRQENRQEWRSDFSQNAGQRQEQRQDRANDIRNEWHDNWHDFHDNIGDPGWRLQYPNLAHGYFHYNHPYAHGWWTFGTVAALTRWWVYPGWGAPIYYDYGSGGNVYYEGDTVYVNDQAAYTADQYAEQAAELAQTGADQLESPDAKPMDWLPLGVFALSTSAAETSPTRMFQLAVSKEGVINGTFYNTETNQDLPILGAVDPKTQRASWYVGDNKNTVAETGVYNLTKDQAPVLIHFGLDRTDEYLLVRLDPPPEEQAGGTAH